MLSPAFLESPCCEAEWAAAFAKDPMGRRRTLVPVRVRDCDPDGLLGPIVYVDMVGLSEAASRDRLLSGLKVRARPASAPTFPAANGVAAGERVRRPAEWCGDLQRGATNRDVRRRARSSCVRCAMVCGCGGAWR